MRTYIGKGAGAHIEMKLLGARRYVLVCSPYISPDYASKIVSLASNNVAIRLITSNSQDPYQQQSLKILKEAITPPRGLFAFRKRKNWKRIPLELMIINEKLVHAKIYVIDGEYAVVGSANMTKNGFWDNIEYIMIFEGDEAQKIEDDFQTLWRVYIQHYRDYIQLFEYEEPITPERSVFGKIVGKIFARD